MGAAAETRTILDAGGTFVLREKKQKVLLHIDELTREMNGCAIAQYELVRDAMDAEGKLKSLDEETVQNLWRQRKDIEEQRKKLRAQVGAIDEQLAHLPPAVIKIGKVLPNTLVRFGSVGKLVKSTLLKIQFTIDGDRIKLTKF